MTITPENEIRSNLIHLLLTRKGSRYFLPDFGTRLYQYIFEPNDSITHSQIESEIRDSIKKYIPNLELSKLDITSLEDDIINSDLDEQDVRLFKPNIGSNKKHTVKIYIEYMINNGVFSSSDFIIINL